jgi:valyl-tRNA synthetase
METGYDILFFWVARMIMMGIENTGDIPFSTVYLHGLVRDEKGEKMSKVRGNVLNPLDTLEQYGTDALRFALSTGTSPGNDIKLTPSRLEAGRNFANKLWNATRFIIGSIKFDDFSPEIAPEQLALEDRWILSRLNRTVASISSLMTAFQFGEAQRQIYDFLWGEFCDWYIEIAKIRLRPGADAPSPISVLLHVMETSLRLLHPFMPFLSEELWQNLKRYLPQGTMITESITIARYPEADKKALDPDAEWVMDSLIEIIRSIRNARAQHKVASNKWIRVQIYADELLPTLSPYSQVIETLARARPITLHDRRQKHPRGENTLVSVLKEAEVAIPMESMVDLEAERKRLEADIVRGKTDITRLEARLRDKDFLSKAPSAVIEIEKDNLSARKARLKRLEEQLKKLTQP